MLPGRTWTSKIVKTGNPTEFEEDVAQQLLNLEVSAAEDSWGDLSELKITAAKEVDVAGGKKAIIITVPFKLLRSYHKHQQRLVRELEKKFSGKHVVIIGQRTVLGKNFSRTAGKGAKGSTIRPRSRTLTAWQDAVLEVRNTSACHRITVLLCLFTLFFCFSRCFRI
jgi:small subunit ribosomal protein S7e